MPDLRTCETCLRRPRHVGGNGSCILVHRRVTVTIGGREERESVEEAWPRHVVQQGVCSSWRLGDRREQPPVVEQEGLF